MIIFVGLIVPSDSKDLLSAASKSAASPFTIALEKAGWSVAGSLINAIIVVKLLSSINSAIYIASRCICAQVKTGRAPSIKIWKEVQFDVAELEVSKGVAWFPLQ
jgi:amino acid transporter